MTNLFSKEAAHEDPFSLAERVGREGLYTRREKIQLIQSAKDQRTGSILSRKIRRHARRWLETAQEAQKYFQAPSALESRALKATQQLQRLAGDLETATAAHQAQAA